jgi:hypothetical protein
VAGLTPDQAAQVVAKVGDRTITLGDVALTLEGMNQFERVRYQSKERRRDLLQQMVDLELLAQEAKRRKLDERPEVQEAIRQILREAMLAKARQGVPAPAEIPNEEVKAYYESHAAQFTEPERRRVAAIVMGDPVKAAEVLADARAAAGGDDAGAKWGELFFEHSLSAPDKKNPAAPADLAGDLGIVGPPGDAQVPAAVQRAVFELGKVGEVHPKVIEADGKLYIVRLSGQSQGHTRSLAEAERAIRVAILQQHVRDREQAFEAELRNKYGVTVDEAALQAIKLPAALSKYQPLFNEHDADDAHADEPTADPSAVGSDEGGDGGD